MGADAAGKLPGTPLSSTVARGILLIGLGALAGLAVVIYLRDATRRGPARAFSQSFHLQIRRPEFAQKISSAVTAGEANQTAADAALEDSALTAGPSELDAGGRRIWQSDANRVGDEIKAAKDLLIAAVRESPGSAWHRSTLGMLDYRQGRTGNQQLRWIPVLDLAARAAPSHQSIASFAGAALADSWPALTDTEKKRAPEIFRAAFRDPQFVSEDYASVVSSIGEAQAAALLPDSAQALNAAIAAEAAAHRPLAAAHLRKRWESAEWRERGKDLALIRDRARFNDVDGVKRACLFWTSHHSAYDFDHPAARNQVTEVLRAWGKDPGAWPTDPRVDLIQFFISGRMASADPKAMLEQIDSLTDVPPQIKARVALAASDLYAAQSAAENADKSSSLDWTQYYVDLAWHFLAAGNPGGALAAANKISPAARDECESALVRRAIAASMNMRSDVDSALFLQEYPAEFWSDSGVPICIDPRAGYKRLAVEITVLNEPALLSVGFDGGRSATVLVPEGNARVRVPLDARHGRHFFSFTTIAGGSVTPRLASLE